MKGVVLAGGTGTRLKPLTEVTNKHLLPIYNTPMIFYPIATLRNAGIKDIIVILGGEGVGDIVRLLKDGSDLDVKIKYAYQEGALGIADALSKAEDFASGDNITVILGDNIFEDSVEYHVDMFETSGMGCSLFLKERDDAARFGVATLDSTGNIIGIEEKPVAPKSRFAVTGLYIYDMTVFSTIKRIRKNIGLSSRGELEITDVNNEYITQGRAQATILGGYWSDAGTFETLLDAGNLVAEKIGKGEDVWNI